MHYQVIKWAKAKAHVYSDSVLCLVKMQEHSEANQRWKTQLEEFRQIISHRELLGIDGKLNEFEWTISQDLLHWKSSRRSKKKTCKIETSNLKILKIEPSSCQCSMTWIGQREEIQIYIFRTPNKSRITRRDSREDTGLSSVLEKKRTGAELSGTHLK